MLLRDEGKPPTKTLLLCSLERQPQLCGAHVQLGSGTSRGSSASGSDGSDGSASRRLRSSSSVSWMHAIQLASCIWSSSTSALSGCLDFSQALM